MGGPHCFWAAARPACVAVVALASLLGAACSGTRGGTGDGGTEPGAALVRPLEVYRELGFMTGTAQFPAVASVATLAGPADSSYVLVGVSLPNSALRFLRQDDAFRAEYGVELLFMTEDSAIVRRETTREAVRVATFAETSRMDESVVFQHAVALAPGRYIVRLGISDLNSARGFGASGRIDVPSFDGVAAAISSPLLVHEAQGRAARDVPPSLVLNPRLTVPFGTATALLYLESYGVAAAGVRIIDDGGVTAWSGTAAFEGAGPVRHALVEIPTGTLPLGRVWIEVDGTPEVRRPLVLTISDQWMVASFDDVLQFLRYIAHPAEITALRDESPERRRAAWDEFWAVRDPLPATAANEFREQFFQRVRHATEAFRETGRPGWQTHRGEVFIVLGPPDQVVERHMGRTDLTGRPNAEEWTYASLPGGGRLSLLFHDRAGIGRLTLVPASATAFRAMADRLRPARPADGDR